MQRNPHELAEKLRTAFGGALEDLSVAFGEVTVCFRPAEYAECMKRLRDGPEFRFEELSDLCGVDYSGFGGRDAPSGRRFAAVSHLLSLHYNSRLRVRVYAENDEAPEVPSVTGIWPSAGWFEREAFDLFGILFSGHPDLRRILTDYGFVGHPFRKDFPVEGFVEMRYDEKEKRVVYQPVTIKPRQVTPRVIRNRNGGGK